MSSPFPGMDPYLERETIFPGLHNRLIAGLSEALQAALPAPYFAEIGERVWDERREPWIEIRTAGEGDERLVTAIEILSPTNKTPGARGRELYLRKQRELLGSSTHLVEIDLLRGGPHFTAVPLDFLRAAVGPFDYHVSIHRSDRPEDFLVYPIQLPEPLPEIAVPLLPGDPEVPIDLQAVFDHAYDVGPYRRRIRYAESNPVPPLPPALLGWADGLVRAGPAGNRA